MLRIRDWWNWLKTEFRWRILSKRYTLVFSDEVQKQLDELPEDVREEIIKAVEHLTRNPYSGERIYNTSEEESS